MLTILRDLDTSSYTFRTYVAGDNDPLSPLKARDFEARLEEQADQNRKLYGGYAIRTVPRARQIHQSLLSAPFGAISCLRASLAILYYIWKAEHRDGGRSKSSWIFPPDVVLSNGPATGAIMILAAFILRVAGFQVTKGKLRTIYVESWARVKSLSLSGKLLCATGICDRVFVQWESTEASLFGIGMKPTYRGAFVG